MPPGGDGIGGGLQTHRLNGERGDVVEVHGDCAGEEGQVIQIGEGGVDGVVDEGVGAEHRQPSGDPVVDLLRGCGSHHVGAGGLVFRRVAGNGMPSSEVVRKDLTVMLSRAGIRQGEAPGRAEEKRGIVGNAAGRIHAVVHQGEEPVGIILIIPLGIGDEARRHIHAVGGTERLQVGQGQILPRHVIDHLAAGGEVFQKSSSSSAARSPGWDR